MARSDSDLQGSEPIKVIGLSLGKESDLKMKIDTNVDVETHYNPFGKLQTVHKIIESLGFNEYLGSLLALIIHEIFRIRLAIELSLSFCAPSKDTRDRISRVPSR